MSSGSITSNCDSSLLRSNSTNLDETWKNIETVVLKIIEFQNTSQKEWQDLFYQVHSATIWCPDWTRTLEERLTNRIVQHVNEAKKRILANQDDFSLLKKYIQEWNKFHNVCDYLPLPFHPLSNLLNPSRGASKQGLQGKYIRNVMLNKWNSIIFDDLKKKLQRGAMKLLRDERNGISIDSALVIGVRESYVALCTMEDHQHLKMYVDNFEVGYLEATDKYYRELSFDYINKKGIQAYMQYATDKLTEEEERGKRYLETGPDFSQSLVKLSDCCVDIFVATHHEALMNECVSTIKTNNTVKLRQLFHLLDRIPSGCTRMQEYLEQYIVQHGLEDMKAQAKNITADCEKYVDQLLSLFRHYTNLVKEAFNDDPRFLTARDRAYKTLVNDTSVFSIDLSSKLTSYRSPESRCPELLANYCDLMLRRNLITRRLNNDEIEAKLRDVILVLKYVNNKDIFTRYHKSHLTRRLILRSSADNDLEESMVDWLRDVGMPAEIIGKLTRMFTDIKLSQDLNTELRSTLRNEDENYADNINITVLNAGAWLKQSDTVPIILPNVLEECLPRVEEFYRNKHQGRRLDWNHLFSHGVIQFQSLEGIFDLEVTTHQMVILFSWNERPNVRLNFDSLTTATGLPELELKRTLWSLLRGQKNCRPLLNYSPHVSNAKDMSLEAEFWINQNFAIVKGGVVQKRGRTNFVGRLQLSLERVKEEENEAILELRRMRIQEAIIKILKMRKSIHHSQLCSELVELLRNLFVPSRKLIKEMLEWLIQENLVKRDDNDMNIFVYVA